MFYKCDCVNSYTSHWQFFVILRMTGIWRFGGKGILRSSLKNLNANFSQNFPKYHCDMQYL